MIFDEDFCACRDCEQGWELKEVAATNGRIWKWFPTPPIEKMAPSFKNRPSKPKTRVQKNNFRR